MSEMIIEGVTDEISSLQLTSKDFYWDGYSHFRTHEQILKDTERVNAFKKAILRNKHLFQNKVVLDVGCGTGILSMFAAQAGAKHVYAVESADITRFTKKIFTANKFDDVITLIKGKIEEVTLPVEKVDIIICSWMGYFLFQESLIQSVLFARDKWLAEGGMIFPDKAYIYVCGVEDSSYKKQKIEWWNRVEGYNFSCVKELVMREPCIDMIETAAIVTDTYFLTSVDLNTVQKGDINLEAKFTLKAQRRDVVDAIVVYFDLEFSHSHHRVWFSTSPYAKWTGYKQTLFYLSHDIEVGKGDAITGAITIKMKENTNREVDIGLSYEFPPAKISNTQAYRLVSN